MHLFDTLGEFVRALSSRNADDVLDFNRVIDNVVASRPIRRRTDKFWPSSINSSYDCERKQAFSRIERIFTDKLPEPPSRVRVADIGVLIHRLVQDNYLALSDLLYGDWRCPNCRQVMHRFQTWPASYCPNSVTLSLTETPINSEKQIVIKCSEYQEDADRSGRPRWLYEELRVGHDELNISGRVDGVIIDKDSDNYDWYTIEIKSTSSDVFNELTPTKISLKKFPALKGTELDGATVLLRSRNALPRANHVSQGSIYSQLLLKAAWEQKVPLNPRNHAGTFFLYVNRDTLDVKAFLREASEADYNAAVDSITRIMSVVNAADSDTSTEPEKVKARLKNNRGMVLAALPPGCSSRTDFKALVCPWQTVCFPYKDEKKNVVDYIV